MSSKLADGYRLLAQAYTVLAEAEDLAATDQRGAGDELLTVRTCGVEANAIKRLIVDGLLPAARLGRKLYFKRSDLLSVVERLSQRPPKPARPKAAPCDEQREIEAAYASLVERARHPSKQSLAALERHRKKRLPEKSAP